MTNRLRVSTEDLRSVVDQLKQPDPPRGRWRRFTDIFFSSRHRELQQLVEKVNRTFVRLEEAGIKIFEANVQDPAYREKARQYQSDYREYFEHLTTIKMHLEERLKEVPKELYPELHEAYHAWQCREASLRYYVGNEIGEVPGFSPLADPDPELLSKIKASAQEWKKNRTPRLDPELNPLEEEQLRELAKYPEWLRPISECSKRLDRVFSWALLNYIQVEPLVKCPETVGKLDKALLKSNLGYVRNLVLTKPENEVLAFDKIEKEGRAARKALTLCLYHGSFEEFESNLQERINILKPGNKILFKQGNYKLTVEKFFEEMAQKNKREVDFSLCADWGFVNFHPIKGVRHWNKGASHYALPEKMDAENWFEKISFARIASQAELEAQYGDDVKGNFFYKTMAARTNTDKENELAAMDCHAFWQLFIRLSDDQWKVINVGFYGGDHFPHWLQGLWLFCASLDRRLCLNDQNGNYTHRQRGGVPWFFTEREKEFLADLYRLKESENTEEREVFQFTGRNCAYWVQAITQKHFGEALNFFKMLIKDTQSGLSVLDNLLAWADRQPAWVGWCIITALHSLLFLSWRWKWVQGRVDSVFQYFMQQGLFQKPNVYNPAYLLYQIQKAQEALKTKGKEHLTPEERKFSKGDFYGSHSEEKRWQYEALMLKEKKRLGKK